VDGQVYTYDQLKAPCSLDEIDVNYREAYVSIGMVPDACDERRGDVVTHDGRLRDPLVVSRQVW
jgi:hypothetical protein